MNLKYLLAGAILGGLYDGLKYAQSWLDMRAIDEKALPWNWGAFFARVLAGAAGGLGLGQVAE